MLKRLLPLFLLIATGVAAQSLQLAPGAIVVQDNQATGCGGTSCLFISQPTKPGSSVIILAGSASTGIQVTGATANGGTWVIPPSHKCQASGTGGSTDCIYNFTPTAGSTNWTVNYNSATSPYIRFIEFQPPPGYASVFDDANGVATASCSTACPGASLNVTGTDFIVQFGGTQQNLSGPFAFSPPYITTTQGNGMCLNCSSGTAPTFAMKSAGWALISAIAIKFTAGVFTVPTSSLYSIANNGQNVYNFGGSPSCVSQICTLPVNSTTSPNLFFAAHANINGTTITSVTCAPVACTTGTQAPVINNKCGITASGDTVGCFYILSIPTGVTSLAVHMSGTGANGWGAAEVHAATGTFAFDDGGTTSKAASQTFNTATLNLTGENDVIFQIGSSSGGTQSQQYFIQPLFPEVPGSSCCGYILLNFATFNYLLNVTPQHPAYGTSIQYQNPPGQASVTESMAFKINPPWTPIVASSRAMDWGFAGLPPVLPDGEVTPNPWTPPTTRTQSGSTIAAGATAATINAAIAACTPGHYVLLGSGLFDLGSSTVNITAPGCSLRMSPQTKILFSANGGSINFNNGNGNNSGIAWSAGYTKGTTTISIGSVSGVVVGKSHIILEGDNGTVDPGGPFYCAAPNFCSEETGPIGQTQNVLVTQCDGNTTIGHACASGANITISPALYLDFSTLTPSVTIIHNENWGAGLEGNGSENATVDCTGNTASNQCIYMGYGYANWVKGVRIINGNNTQVTMTFSKSLLFANNYMFAGIASSRSNEGITQNTDSDDLMVNNIISQTSGDIYWQSASSGTVSAYNFDKDGWSNSANQTFIANVQVDHQAGEAFSLREGNIIGSLQHDAIHGTHNFMSDVRNLIYGNDPPYTKTSGIAALTLEGYTRFTNVIGNVLGSATTSSYKSTPQAPHGAPNIAIGLRPGFQWSTGYPLDFLAPATTMLWGNWDTINAATQFNSAEVPSALNTATGFTQNLAGSGTGPWTTTLSNLPCVLGNELLVVNLGGTTFVGVDQSANGSLAFFNSNGTGTITPNGSTATVNCTTGAVTATFTTTPTGTPSVQYLQQTASASAFRNPVPANNTLPTSFFLPVQTAAPSGGTGLSWWKVCTNYPTCSTTITPPFPNIGPDVSGGNIAWNGINYAGHANENPAAIAWRTLPIDASYQQTFTISSSSWASGVETLTFGAGVLPGSTAPVGEFQLTGAPAACVTGYTNGQISMINSSATTVQYTLPVNPGVSCATATFKYPDIRVFNESVYLTDSTSGPTAPGVSFSPSSVSFPNTTVSTSATPIAVTLTNTGTAPLTISGMSLPLTANPPFNFSTSPGFSCGGSLAPAATCTITFTFFPTQVASYSTTFTMTDNASGSPHTFAVTGTGTGSIIFLVPNSLNFGNQTVGTTSSFQTVTVQNTGNITMTGISILSVDPVTFPLQNSGAGSCVAAGNTLAAGASCTFQVAFHPSSVGAVSNSVSVSSSALNSPSSVSVSGNGTILVGPTGCLLNGGILVNGGFLCQ